MSGIEVRDEKPEVQEDIDRAVEEALDLDFASFEEVKEAFRE